MERSDRGSVPNAGARTFTGRKRTEVTNEVEDLDVEGDDAGEYNYENMHSNSK